MLDKILDEATNLMVVLLVLAMIVAYAATKWTVIVAVLVKFFSL